MELISNSPEETQALGQALGSIAKDGDVFLLGGGLGVGKTCLTQGIAWGLDIKQPARSPTFVLVTELQGRLKLYHADLYRLDSLEEVLDLGLGEYLEEDGVLVVEWAEKAPEAFPVDHMWITLEWLTQTTRKINLFPSGHRYQDVLVKLEEKLHGVK
jgi:tRNA threonylcarbamoyladenosine biosynthesis protein TsaE